MDTSPHTWRNYPLGGEVKTFLHGTLGFSLWRSDIKDNGRLMGLLRKGQKTGAWRAESSGLQCGLLLQGHHSKLFFKKNYLEGSVKPSHSATSLGFNHKSKISRSVGFFSQLNRWCRSCGPRPQSGQLSFTSGEIRLLYELRRVEYPDLSWASLVRASLGSDCSSAEITGGFVPSTLLVLFNKLSRTLLVWILMIAFYIPFYLVLLH